jgi:hypothetical protein
MIEKFTQINGARFWREFQSTGLLLTRLGEVEASLTDDPRALIEHVTGGETVFIRPDKLEASSEKTSQNVLGEELVYVTSPSSYFPPHLQFYILPEGVSASLKLYFLDSWNLLQDSENRSADLYSALFNRIRMMRFAKSAWLAPTFSVRNNCLIFATPPKLGERDKIGERVKNWLNNREPIEVELVPGEMLIVDNHRFARRLDSNSNVQGAEAYSVWTENFTSRPNAKHLLAAKAFQNKLASVFPFESESLKLRFGLSDCKLDDYIRASNETPIRMDELMPIYKKIFELLYPA